MNGSKQNLTERQQILESMKTPPVGGYFVWDGEDEDDRPLSHEEMQVGILKAQQLNNNGKTEIALQVDNEIVAYFRATGQNWQNRMNDALKEWLREHSVAIS
ncbi:MAG: BrnA antitoxin family protein [Methylococcaceae bacterium]